MSRRVVTDRFGRFRFALDDTDIDFVAIAGVWDATIRRDGVEISGKLKKRFVREGEPITNSQYYFKSEGFLVNSIFGWHPNSVDLVVDGREVK